MACMDHFVHRNITNDFIDDIYSRVWYYNKGTVMMEAWIDDKRILNIKESQHRLKEVIKRLK